MNEEGIFQVAAVMPAAERAAYLAAACEGQSALRERIERLLVSHDDHNFMQRSADRADSLELEAELARLKPEESEDRIGSYKLLQKIGEGGFGTVWMADQLEPVRRRVALKIIKPGMDTKEVIVRFEQERQALALMDHPSIAKVLDAGVTLLGRPFFVMELVRGIRITDFCDQNNLLTAERLDLFIAVCNAIQHAHQKGIIHRDIKPSNILVALHDGGPVPKVIDFGVAKATQSQRLTDLTFITRFEQMIGTPLYMSPEQAEMSSLDIDTRSDIYSLGVLLYELLTGHTPFDPEKLMRQGLDELRRVIREQEPLKPSTFVSTMASDARTTMAQHRQVDGVKLLGQIRGDLDWIVMKCLEKDRSRRYDTANGLAADLRRHLNNEPVVARPPSTAYRFQKAFRRNKLVFAATGAVGLTMLLALVVLTASILRISKEKNLKDVALRERGSALAEAQDQLFLALLNQARASRFSGHIGQRLGSLEALTTAARIRSDDRLRDEAIAAMALVDIRLGPAWPPVLYGCVDDDYRISAAADEKGTLYVRTVPEGREITRIESGRRATRLALSTNGTFLAQVDDLQTLRVWRVSDGQSVLRERPQTANAMAFSRDGHHIVAGQKDRVLRFDLAHGRETNRWQTAGQVNILTFSPDGSKLAVGYGNQEVTSVYDPAGGKLLVDLPVGPLASQFIAWHPDGARLAVSGDNPRVQIWDTSSRIKLATLEGHVEPVTGLSFHPGGEILVSGGTEGVLLLWNPSSGRRLLQFPRLLSAFGFSQDGRWLGGISNGEKGQLLEIAASPEYRTIVSSLGAGRDEYFDGDISPDGRFLAMAMLDGVRVWELTNLRELAFLPIERTHSAIFQPDGHELITCGSSGLHRWPVLVSGGDASTRLQFGPPVKIQLPFASPPTRIARSRDGRTLAVVSGKKDGGALIVDLTTDLVQGSLKPHSAAGYVALSGDGRWLATAGWNSDKVCLWKLSTGELVHEWQKQRGVMVSFDPNSRTLILSTGGRFEFWDVASMQVGLSIPCDEPLYPTHVVFTSDGALMALEMAPGLIHLKESKTGRTVAKLTDPSGSRATWMKFSPEGDKLVAAASYAKAIHVWDLRAIRVRLKDMGLDWDWPEFP